MQINFIDNSPQVLSAFDRQCIVGLNAIAHEAEGYAKDDCPVDTTRLRTSISNKVDEAGKAAYIGTNVEYAVYVEYRDNVNHPVGKAHFLRDAATTHGAHYQAIMQAALKAGS